MNHRTTPSASRELGWEESLRLLGSVGVGRIVFSHQALPAIRPVNHILHDGQIIVHTQPGAAVLSSLDTVVAYEADRVCEDDHIAWSVIAVGIARRVRDRHEISRYHDLLRPRVRGEMTEVLRIDPELVTGLSLNGENSCPAA